MVQKEAVFPKSEQELDVKLQALAERRTKREAEEARSDYGIDVWIVISALVYGLFFALQGLFVDALGEETVSDIEWALKAAAFSTVLLVVSRSLRRIIAYRAGIRLK